MLALWGTFVSGETLDSLVSTRYVTDLLVYETHMALNTLRDELFDQEIIDYSISSWEQIGQNILLYTAARLGWLQLGICFWGSAYAPRNGGIEKGSSQSDIQPLRAALEGSSGEHGVQTPRKACCINLFVQLTKSQMTSLAALRCAEFVLNGGGIYILYHATVRMTGVLEEIVWYLCPCSSVIWWV